MRRTAAEFADLSGKVVPIACHVGRLDQLEALVRETESRLGPIDVLVNNSATNIGQGPSLAVTDEMLDEIVVRAEVKHHHYLNFSGSGEAASTRAIGLRFIDFVDAGERVDPARLH